MPAEQAVARNLSTGGIGLLVGRHFPGLIAMGDTMAVLGVPA